MAKGSETTAMMVDTQVSSTDDSYLDSLEEPWKSLALKAIPPSTTEESSSALQDAASRLDQFELDVRSQFLQVFFDSEPSETVKKAGEFWKAALSLCLHMVHGASKSKVDPRYVNMAPRKLPVLLIEDCLDALMVEGAQEFWADYVEPSLDRPPQLLGDLMWKSSNACHLPFLRVCNQFLRLLDTASHSKQCEWKGRILTALAKGFSIADRSALKFWGTFNSSNVTDFESEETFQANSAPTTSKATSAAPKMDYNLYESFWSLQADFSNPNRIQVAAFIRKLKIVLEALESAASSSSTATAPACASLRYMTSSSLLPTQLATAEFRSSVVAQFLISASHLSSESPALANALLPLLTRAKKLLQSDNPDLYNLLWESILTQREDVWRKWKKEKCPVSAFAPKQTPESGTSDSPANGKSLMGGALGSSSEAPAKHEYESLQADELLKVSQDLKKAIPSLEGHLEPYVEALDPESGIEAAYHPGNDPLFAWRAMRLYAKHQLPLLKQCRRPADLERITRELYRQQGKDIPGEMPPEPPEEDDDDSEKEDIKGSEMEEDEHEKEDPASSDTGSQDGSQSSEDEGEEEGVSPVGGAVMKDQNEEEQEEKLSGKEQGDTGDDKSEGSVSVEEKEQADDTNDQTKRNSDGDDDDDQAKRDNDKISKEKPRDETKDTEKENSEDSAENYPSGKESDSKEKTKDKKTDEKGSAKLENAAGDEAEDPDKSKAVSREASDEEDDNKGGDLSRRRDASSRKRRRSRSEERDRNKAPRGDRRDSGNRGAGRRNDGPSRGRGRNANSGSGRRDEGPPPRGGRGGGAPPPRREDGPPPHGRGGGRHEDGPHGRTGGRHDVPPPRRQDDGPPPSGRGGGGRGGGDRRDDRNHGGDRRRGRDDSRFRGRR
jgi:hypothetical protein